MTETLAEELPSLPIGYFWRVGKKEGETGGAGGFNPSRGYGISLRRQHWLWSEVIDRSGVVFFRSDVITQAKRMEEKFRSNATRREAEQHKRDDCGDYHSHIKDSE